MRSESEDSLYEPSEEESNYVHSSADEAHSKVRRSRILTVTEVLDRQFSDLLEAE